MNEPSPPDAVLVPFGLFQAIANYLGACPYNDVAPMIDGLRQCQGIVHTPTPAVAESDGKQG